MGNSDFEFLASSNKKLCNYFTDLIEKVEKQKKKESKTLTEEKTKTKIGSFFIDNLLVSHVFGMFNPFFQDKLRGIETSKEKSKLLKNSQLSGLFAWIFGLKVRDTLIDNNNTNYEFNLNLISVVFVLLNSHKKKKIKNVIIANKTKNEKDEQELKEICEIIVEMNKRYLKNFENEQLIPLIELRKLINLNNPISNFFNKCIKRKTIWDWIINETIMNILDLTDIEDIKFVFSEMEKQKDNLKNDNRIVKLINYYHSFLYNFC